MVKVRVSYQADPEHAMKVLQQWRSRTPRSCASRRPWSCSTISATRRSISRTRLPRRHQSLAAGADRAAHAILKALRAEPASTCRTPRRSPASARPGADGTACHGVDRRRARCDPEAVQAALAEAARRSGFAGATARARRSPSKTSATTRSTSRCRCRSPTASARRRRRRRCARRRSRRCGARHRVGQPQRQVRLRDRKGCAAFVMKLAEERARRGAARRRCEDAPPRKPNGD